MAARAMDGCSPVLTRPVGPLWMVQRQARCRAHTKHVPRRRPRLFARQTVLLLAATVRGKQPDLDFLQLLSLPGPRLRLQARLARGLLADENIHHRPLIDLVGARDKKFRVRQLSAIKHKYGIHWYLLQHVRDIACCDVVSDIRLDSLRVICVTSRESLFQRNVYNRYSTITSHSQVLIHILTKSIEGLCLESKPHGPGLGEILE